MNGVTVVTGATAIVDTGTTYIKAPTANVAAYHAQIPGATYDSATKLWSGAYGHGSHLYCLCLYIMMTICLH